MFLILEVKSANAGMLGPASRAVFTAAGGSIGRRPGNDWVLPDPHISGRHARVRAIGGTFFLEDNESANGVIVNGNRLHPGEPFPLKDGDTVFIDPFEMVVTVSATKPGAATQVLDAPVPPAPAPVSPPPLVGDIGWAGGGPPQPEGLGDIIGDSGGTLGSGPNPLLDGPVGVPQAPRYDAGSLVGKPVIHDAISMPTPAMPIPPPPAAPSSAVRPTPP